MVDDDPELPLAQAPEGRPADDKEPTPTAEPPEGDKPEGDEAEAKPDEELDIGDEQDEQEDEDESEGEEPKRKRLERYRRQAERLKAENEALRNRPGGSLPSNEAALQRAFEHAVWQEIGDPPKPEDFKDDYVGLSIARQAWENDRRQVTRQIRKEFVNNIEAERARVSELIVEHKERVAAFKSKVKDFDQVMAQATLPVEPHVERLLLHSKKSERLGYVLAKNQNKLAQLNRMSAEEAAREIGRLEGRLSLPQNAKTQTQARKPIKPLKGAGASAPSGLAAVNALMKKYGYTR